MSGFLFAFLGVLICGIGARDQALLAGMTRAQGQRPLLLIAAIGAAWGTTAFAAWAAGRVAADLAPAARVLFAAFALCLAGAEMLVLKALRNPAEPTGSLFAAFVVLAAMQLTDGARFLILAIGVATSAPVTTAVGGALGALVTLCAGWVLPSAIALPLVCRIRIAAGALLILVGLWLIVQTLIA